MGWATCPPYPQKLPAHLQKQVRRMFFKIESLPLFQQLFYFIHFGLNALSTCSRSSTTLQECNTVACVRFPISEPIRANDRLVCFGPSTWLFAVPVLRVVCGIW